MSTNKRDYMREYMAEYRRTNPRKDTHAAMPFVGVDGEGRNLDNGYHAYFMLRCGDSTLWTRPGMVRLSTKDCLEFLCSQSPRRIYVGYYFDYDVTKILEDLSFDKLDRLMHRELRVRPSGGFYPVSWGGYELDYLPGKEFKVRRSFDDGTVGQWVTINDVGSFFQCRFIDAVDSWQIATPEERDLVMEGKELRGSFTLDDMALIDRYNTCEISLLEQLMERFRDACNHAGYVPRRWQGPGQLAEAMFNVHRVPLSKQVELFKEKQPLVLFAQNAFYGGRPEVSAVGPIPGPVYQWDINSAYPYAMLSVPCLHHGRWEYEEISNGDMVRDIDRPTGVLGESYSLVYGSFSGRRVMPYYGIPTRIKDGTIVYPRDGRGWYWDFEVSASRHQQFTPEQRWRYRRECECKPLAFVEDIYAERQRIGKDGPGVVLKLGLNSLYGKTVQSVGKPRYSNPIWGSFITAYCRTMVQEFIHSSPRCPFTCGQDVLMIATDSVCTTTNREDIESTKELGGWSRETHPDGIFIVQPGLYFTSSGKPSRTRGIPREAADSLRATFADRFTDMVTHQSIDRGSVRVPQTTFVGIKYALHRHNMKLLGQWIEYVDPETEETGRVISFDWRPKRREDIIPPTEQFPYVRTIPPDGDSTVETIPYDKEIGGLLVRQELRLPLDAQPDWNVLPEAQLCLEI